MLSCDSLLKNMVKQVLKAFPSLTGGWAPKKKVKSLGNRGGICSHSLPNGLSQWGCHLGSPVPQLLYPVVY